MLLAADAIGGIGFDARVLRLNRDAAATLAWHEPHAEVFELRRVIGGAPQAYGG
jgi:hypothetical protein